MPVDASRFLRGPEGTEVTVTVYRPSWRQNLVFTMERALITVHPVVTKDLGDGLYYIDVNEFSSTTGRDVTSVMDEVRSKGAEGIAVSYTHLDVYKRQWQNRSEYIVGFGTAGYWRFQTQTGTELSLIHILAKPANDFTDKVKAFVNYTPATKWVVSGDVYKEVEWNGIPKELDLTDADEIVVVYDEDDVPIAVKALVYKPGEIDLVYDYSKAVYVLSLIHIFTVMEGVIRL